MKKNVLIVTYVLCTLLTIGLLTSCHNYQTVKGDNLHARIYTLKNGLTVYLTQNKDKPEIQSYIVVRAGAQNDPLESTGLAHYMEHIMFNGTSQYGTTDYQAEKVYLDQIDSLYEVYGQTTDAEQRRAIYHEIDSISYLSSKIAIASEFSKLMEGIGATEVNAYTGIDRTCYHEVIPSSELERWAAIERGRFTDLVVRGFHTELEVVYEEFNMSTTNDFRKVWLAIDQLLYPNIPYLQHSVLGTQDHLQNPSLINIKKFWNTYYRPNNVAICLSGDLDYNQAIATIEKYFGDWEANEELPALNNYEILQRTAPKDTIVMGLEAPEVWLSWNFPGTQDADADIIEIIPSALYNGSCGLFDVDIVQQQRMLNCFVYVKRHKSYTNFSLNGTATEGQTLDSVRAILMTEIDKLKEGNFSEEMLQGVIANERRNALYREQNNQSRCELFMETFINDIPWEQMVGKLDRMATITKDDVVRVANQYFTDGYVVVYKQQGKDTTLREITKPAISPIEMNRDLHSAFTDSLLAIETPAMQPQYLDMDKDVVKEHVQGRELLYRQNVDDELFELTFITNGGTKQNPFLMLSNIMDYMGTDTKSAEELKKNLYLLTGDINVFASEDETHFGISGLQENLPKILALFEDKLLHSVADSSVYNQLVADYFCYNEAEKANQKACFDKLLDYGFYGQDVIQQNTLTPEKMSGISASQLIAWVREKALSSAQVLYYGPLSVAEVKNMLDTCALLQGEVNLTKADHNVYLPVNHPEVLVAPYDAPNFYFVGYANWGEVYSLQQEALIRVFNQYFDGTFGSVVFQEMRETRALAYRSEAGYVSSDYSGDNNYFYTHIISQTDKLQDCVEAFAQICDSMPQSEMTFEKAKKAVLLSIEQNRYTRSSPLWVYRDFHRLGWDHDWNEDVYREVQKMTLDDLVAFQKEHVANRTYRYIILGNPKKLDMKYLKTLGNVQQLSIKDIFVY